jgi:hypothetical protein
MARLGGEKMSRLSVGLFALALTGGLAAFFTGMLDSYFAGEPPAIPQPPAAMPFAKPKPAAASSVAAFPVPPVSVSPAEVVVSTATPSAPVKAAIPASAEVEQPLVSTLDERTPAVISDAIPSDPAVVKPARKRDLDMRSCLDLPTEMEMAQCAYKLQ